MAPKWSRRKWLGTSAGFAAAAPFLGFDLPSDHPVVEQPARAPNERRVVPDLIITGGTIVTMDPAQPRAEAVAIAGDRFIAVGRADDVKNLATASTKVLDARGKTVLPGLIDAHLHGASSGVARLSTVDAGVTSLAELKKRVREQAAKTPPGGWIRATGYDDTKLGDLHRFITRHDLDEAAGDHPLVVTHRGGHIIFVNSKALEIANIRKPTEGPSGGKIDKDPVTGEPTGVIRERASALVMKHVPDFSREERHKGATWMLQKFAESGLTSVHDASASVEDVRAYMDAYARGELATRVYLMVQFAGITELNHFGIRTGFGDTMLRIGGTKLVADGAISGRTARLSQPYIGRPDDYGILAMQPAELDESVRAAHAADWQVGTHANGDVTIAMVLDAYEKALKAKPKRDHRFRIEHCTLVNPDILRRMKAGGFIPTPFCTYVYWHSDKMPDYGEERLKWMFAMRSFLDGGIPVTGSSDYTPGPFEPMMGIMSCVTRKGKDGKIWGANQKITVDEAIRCYTLNSAHAGFEEHLKGSVEAGKLADLVVLGADPYTVEPDTIINIPVERTMVGGKFVWQRTT